MKQYFRLISAVVFSTYILLGCSRHKAEPAEVRNLSNLTVTPSMKGWELYTWPEANNWKFAFLNGTNRLKSLEEVMSSTSAGVLIRVTGADSAKMVLNKFPEGESITLIGQGWLKNAWQGQYGNLQLPPQAVIDQLRSLASQKKLALTVTN